MSWLYDETPERFQQIPNMSPQQMQWGNQAGKTAMQQYQNPYQGFAPIEQNYMRQFQQETIPGLANQFASLGGGENLMGGGFAQQLGSSGVDLLSNLADLKSQYGMQNRNQAMEMLKFGMMPQFDTRHIPATRNLSTFGSILGGLGTAGLGALGSFLGPVGTAMGTGLGAWLSNKYFPQQQAGQEGMENQGQENIPYYPYPQNYNPVMPSPYGYQGMAGSSNPLMPLSLREKMNPQLAQSGLASNRMFQGGFNPSNAMLPLALREKLFPQQDIQSGFTNLHQRTLPPTGTIGAQPFPGFFNYEPQNRFLGGMK